MPTHEIKLIMHANRAFATPKSFPRGIIPIAWWLNKAQISLI